MKNIIILIAVVIGFAHMNKPEQQPASRTIQSIKPTKVIDAKTARLELNKMIIESKIK